MGGTKSHILGTRPAGGGSGFDDDDGILGDGDAPGPIGIDGAIPLGGPGIIAKVVKDWDPPNPKKVPEINVKGKTIEQVGNELMKLGEWGQAGGSLRADRISDDRLPDQTVTLHGNLLYRLPTWDDYSSASAAAKAEWDKMFVKLKAHEDRHLAIAIEEGDRLAAELVGKRVAEIGTRVTAANARMKQRQDKLDAETQNGSKAGVPYGDVTLDISVI